MVVSSRRLREPHLGHVQYLLYSARLPLFTTSGYTATLYPDRIRVRTFRFINTAILLVTGALTAVVATVLVIVILFVFIVIIIVVGVRKSSRNHS